MSDADQLDAYARHDSLYNSVPVPPHVSRERVVDFDYLHPPGMEDGDVYTAWKRLHDGPDIIWTPRNGGHWILTRGADIRYVQENFEVFSHEVFTIPRGSSTVHMPPLTVDPPLHARYRAVINPFFTPNRIAGMRERVEKLTIGLANSLKPAGGCEFVNAFARIMPVEMFLGIVDLPLENRAEFVEWGVTFITSTNAREKLGAQEKVVAYLRKILEERTTNPGDDLLSRIAAWRGNARYQGEHEVIGMAMLVFFGGLDTVANMLSFIVRHLAQHPEHRQRLREHPEIIPQAVEEFVRRFGLSNTGRLVTRDFDYKGVRFMKDEMVMVPIALSSMDERLYDDPLTIDLDRRPVHSTFGNGPHRCVGAPLARTELAVFLEHWLRIIPDFQLDPRHPPVTHSGAVNGVDSLHLVWNAQ